MESPMAAIRSLASGSLTVASHEVVVVALAAFTTEADRSAVGAAVGAGRDGHDAVHASPLKRAVPGGHWQRLTHTATHATGSASSS